MLLFLKFLLAHILGDFVFQPEKCVKKKRRKKLSWKYSFGFLLIFTPHYSIDLQELYIQNKTYKTNLVFYRSNTAYINSALSKRFIC